MTRNANRAREIITAKGNRTKLRQFGDGVVEARNKARMLTTELEDLDPDSIESDGTWLQDVEENAREVLGEIEDYLQSRANDAPALSDDDIRSVHSREHRQPRLWEL